MADEKQEDSFAVGDVIPIQQVVGYQVVKRIENGEPVVVTVEKPSDAEILSYIFKQYPQK